jgi:hypothetical protein
LYDKPVGYMHATSNIVESHKQIVLDLNVCCLD